MAVLAAGALLGAPAGLGAQGAVSGQVTLVEKNDKPSKDLQNAVIWLEPKPAPKKPFPAMKATVGMHGREFLPHVTVVTPGSAVKFANEDPFHHNAFSNTDMGSFDFGVADRGTSSQEIFKEPGIYPVFCDIHAKMS
ncbi:MAG TPA: hypothetical protein VMT93_05715, partial [Gemmatimonadaceae bacterium]|nr:hypothetical protein [Gemmatimonadaceae bacterium]